MFKNPLVDSGDATLFKKVVSADDVRAASDLQFSKDYHDLFLNELKPALSIYMGDVFKAYDEKLLPESVFEIKFSAFLTTETLPVLHSKNSCGVYFSSLNESFLTLNDLPNVFVPCNDCARVNFPGFIDALSKDLLVYQVVFKNSTGFENDVFNFQDNWVPALQTFQSNAGKKHFLESFQLFNTESLCFENKNFVFTKFLCKEVLRPLKKQTDEELQFIFKGWLDAPKELFYKFVSSNRFITEEFDDTLILSRFSFEDGFYPEISFITSRELNKINDEIVVSGYQTVTSIINDTFLRSYSYGTFFDTATVVSCLIHAFKVREYTEGTDHLVLMPRSLHQFLLHHLGLLNDALRNDAYVSFENVISVVVSDYTPELIENFVGIWDENPKTFMSAWEIARTV